MKLIVLLVGLVLGAAGGIFFSANYPEYAAKLAAKENDLIAEGKRQAMEQIKAKLDGILSQQDATPVKTPGSSMFRTISPGLSKTSTCC